MHSSLVAVRIWTLGLPFLKVLLSHPETSLLSRAARDKSLLVPPLRDFPSSTPAGSFGPLESEDSLWGSPVPAPPPRTSPFYGPAPFSTTSSTIRRLVYFLSWSPVSFGVTGISNIHKGWSTPLDFILSFMAVLQRWESINVPANLHPKVSNFVKWSLCWSASVVM